MRVLIVCDRVPMPEMGGRFATLAARVTLLAEAGYHVTLYPLAPERPDAARLARTYGNDIEILRGAGTGGLAALLDGRRQGFDSVWIAGRNVLEQCLFTFHQIAYGLPTRGFVLDLPGLVSVEQRGRRRLGNVHNHEALMADLDAELRDAWFCQMIVVGNEEEAALVRRAGYDNVQILTHGVNGRQDAQAMPGFADRHNILCMPSIQASGDPAHDGIDWFVNTAAPLLDRVLPPEATIDIAGYRPADVDLSPLARHRRVRFVSPDLSLSALCRSHRVLVMPDRFSAGLPPEALAAAEAGLPAVLSDDIAARLGWEDGLTCLTGGVGDAARCVDMINRLYTDADLWTSLSRAVRTAAQDHVGRSQAISTLQSILTRATADPAMQKESASVLIPSEGLS